MRAMVLEKAGAPLRLEERAVLEPGPDQVLVRVRACGVCRTDLHVVDGELSEPKLPLVPGHEVVGTVAARGGRLERFAIMQAMIVESRPPLRKQPIGTSLIIWRSTVSHSSDRSASVRSSKSAPESSGRFGKSQ